MKKSGTAATIDDYIASFPPEVQAILQKIRATVAKAVPEGHLQFPLTERIPYGLIGRIAKARARENAARAAAKRKQNR
jgi:uncharacterized protein YdhG (YjbR/CyaY superfamily)